MKLGLVLAVLILGAAIECSAAPRTQSGPPDPHAASLRRMEVAIKYLQLAQVPVGKAVRVYFNGTCDARDHVLFPKINIQPPVNGETGLGAIRHIFRNDRKVTVTEDRSGMIRIRIGDISAAILNTRLSLLRLSQDARYNPNGPDGAIDAVLGAASVKTAMDRFRVRQMSSFFIIIWQQPMSSLPHLPSSMKNVTVDQALDSIARTFRGNVMYGECTKPDGSGLIDITFQPLHTGE